LENFKTQEELEALVDKSAGSFRQVSAMYHNADGSINQVKLERIQREMPEFKKFEEFQKTTISKLQRVRALLQPDAPLTDLKIVAGHDNNKGPGYGPQSAANIAVFADELSNGYVKEESMFGLNKRAPRSGVPTNGFQVTQTIDVTPANKGQFVRDIVWRLQTAENQFNIQKAAAIRKNVAQLQAEVSGTQNGLAGAKQQLTDIEWQLKRSKEIRRNPHDISTFKAANVDSESEFQPKYESPRKAFASRKHGGVHINVEVDV